MKRFAPEISYTEDRCWGDWVTSTEAKMVESRSGNWTLWQNAHDAIQMYKKREERLEARIRRLEDELFLQSAHLPE